LAGARQLGGWKDPQTILKCYQSPDEESMRAALAERRVLRGASVVESTVAIDSS
jgi:hypothetical protein